MKKNDIADQFTEFLREKYYKDLAQAVSLGNNSLRIDFQELDKFNPALADAILENPAENLELINKSVEEIDFPKKQPVNIRFFNLPESTAIRIRNLRAEHIGNFLTIDGIVKRASEVRPEISEIVFECQECGQRLKIIQDKKSKKVKYPVKCDCGNRRNFKIIKEKLYDARWIAVEEPFEITTGERPSEIMVYLKEDLVSPKMRNRSEPGNRIKVFGVLEEIPRTTSRGKRTRQMDILIHANNFEVSEEEWEEIEIDPEEEKKIKEFAKDPKIYEKLTASLAPTMYGLEPIKLSIVLQLFGGTPHELKDGTRIRGDIHILLIGDPSTGKSRLLKLASDMMPRGKYVSGKGVTGAGLCVKGDSKVFLGDGKILEIRDLVERELKKGELEKENGIIVAKNPKKQKIISLDEEDMKIKPLEISQYWKIPAPKKMVKITTRSGKTVECTLDNPIPTIEDGGIFWKTADSLSEKDSVATVRKISEKLANSDIFWDEIEKVEIVENDSEDFVYDLTIEGTHSFMVNGVIVHNTASVVKDEQFMGGWVLEAGALVLANKSLVSIDEFEKVNKEDQVAMHEALSLQTVSIAKASIVATLPSKTSILAGANPKLSRFDPYIPIREQINIPETLLSRFDLKFALRDVPDVQKDEKIVDHILDSRHFKTDEIAPKIATPFLKKYIAYTKLNCQPKLTEPAGKKLKDFYINLRSKSTSEESPVPITLRQYEGLIRLSEASAKVRLSEKVEEEDAERAIEVLKYSLRQFGFDPETGLIDIDRAEGAMATSSQRSKIRIMLDVIDELHNTIGKNIPVEEITRRAKEEGVERPSDIIKKMKEEGLVFEPKPRVIQKV